MYWKRGCKIANILQNYVQGGGEREGREKHNMIIGEKTHKLISIIWQIQLPNIELQS